jgi:hypothetical protein
MEYSRMNTTTNPQVPSLNATHEWKAERQVNADLFGKFSVLGLDLMSIVEWADGIDWTMTKDRTKTYTNQARLDRRVLDIRDAFGQMAHELETTLQWLGDAERTGITESRLSFRCRGFGRVNVISHGLENGLIALAEHHAQLETKKFRKVRGRAFGDVWNVTDFSKILKVFNTGNTRTTLGKAYIPVVDYDPTFTYTVPAIDRDVSDGYEYAGRSVTNSVPRTLSGLPIRHRMVYRLFSHDGIDVYDVIPIDPVKVRNEASRSVPQVFAVIEKRGDSSAQQTAAIVDRRGTVLFKGDGIDLLMALACRIDHTADVVAKVDRLEPYVIRKPKTPVSKASHEKETKTPLFDLEAVREASRPNTDEEKFDDLIASALANPEIRELAGRLLVKIADHVRR